MFVENNQNAVSVKLNQSINFGSVEISKALVMSCGTNNSSPVLIFFE